MNANTLRFAILLLHESKTQKLKKNKNMLEYLKKYTQEADNDFLVAHFNSAEQKYTQIKAWMQKSDLRVMITEEGMDRVFLPLAEILDKQIALAKSFDELDALKSSYIKNGSQQYIKHHLLSKSTYIRGLQCTKALYLNKFHPKYKTPTSAKTQLLFDAGRSFEDQFRSLFVNAIDLKKIFKSQFHLYSTYTEALIAKGKEIAIFEAAFVHNEVLVLTDVLHQENGNKFTIYEVKNSTTLTEVIMNDAAIQYYVCKSVLKSIEAFKIVLATRDGDFEIIDVTAKLEEKMTNIPKNIERLKLVLKAKQAPCVSMGAQCNKPYTCEFIAHCSKEETIGKLPINKQSLLDRILRVIFLIFKTN